MSQPKPPARPPTATPSSTDDDFAADLNSLTADDFAVDLATLAPEAPPSGPRPNSPQDLLERGSRAVFGEAAPMVNWAATKGMQASPLGLVPTLLEGGASAGGMIGGALGGLGSRSYAGGVAGAAGGGAIGGGLQRWFRGEPQTAPAVTTDAIIQGGLQAVAPGVGKVLEKFAAPIYRMALGAPKALVEEFGDVGAQALKEGRQVGQGGAAVAAAQLKDAGARKGAAIAEATARGARKSTPADVPMAPFREILRDARLLKQGGGDPPVGEIVRQARGLKAGMGRHGGVELEELDAMKQLVQKENSAALRAAASDKPVHPLQKQAGMARASVLREMAEDRAKEVGVNLRPLNERYQELIPVDAALRNAEFRRLSGGQRGWQGIADRFARTLAVPQLSSAAAIGMDRTGKALGGDRLTNAVRLLMMKIAAEDEQREKE